MPNRFKELLEKLKVHADENNDDELKKIIASFETAESEETEEASPGGNHPEPPDVP